MKIITLSKISLLAGLLVSHPIIAGEVSVAVAANFTSAMRDVATLFEKVTGHNAKISYGSTGKLYAQIAAGAPFEVYLAADVDRAVKAEQAGLAVVGTRFSYARGKLVLWSANADEFQDGEAFLSHATFQRAAIANPQTAPYGFAAQQVLQHLGIWDAVQSRLVRGDSIAQVFQFTATGNVPVGFIAYSQLQAWRGPSGRYWEIPQDHYAPINQQAVLLTKGQDNPAAAAFMAFLKSVQVRKIITVHGYVLP